MSEPRNQFTFYRSFYDAAVGLPEEEQAALIMAIAGYALYEIEPELDGASAAIFQVVRPVLDSSRRKSEANKAYAKRVLEESQTIPKGNPEESLRNPQGNPDKGKNKNKDKDKDKSKDKNKVKNKNKYLDSGGERSSTPSRFTPPTVDEVRDYCMERGNDVDPQRFYDFYSSKGWKVGQNAMKDWRAAVRTWERRDDYRGGSAVPFPARQDNRNDNPFLQMLREEEMQ